MITDLDLAIEKVRGLSIKRPRVLILSSCTGMKRMPPKAIAPLSIQDIKDKARFGELRTHRHPAEELYVGPQHRRMMAAVKEFRANGRGYLDLRIISAGFGVVRGEQKLPPYDVTFLNMSRPQIRRWATELRVPVTVDELMKREDDLKIIALGSDYLEAAQLQFADAPGGLTVLLCSPTFADLMPMRPNVCVVPLGKEEASKYRAPLIALKGELTARLLRELLASMPQVAQEARA